MAPIAIAVYHFYNLFSPLSSPYTRAHPSFSPSYPVYLPCRSPSPLPLPLRPSPSPFTILTDYSDYCRYPGLNTCSQAALCATTNDSRLYTCTCRPGFLGDGRVCEEKGSYLLPPPSSLLPPVFLVFLSSRFIYALLNLILIDE